MTAGMRRLVVIAIVLLAGVRAGAGPLAQPVGESSFDRPAMWIADRATYTVEILCQAGVEILTDDLAPAKLKLTGLEVLSSDNSRVDEAGSSRYRFRYVLTAYAVEPPPAVAPIPVRYYAARPGQRPEQVAPAGVIYVPGGSVTLRSLLPDNQFADVRDGRPVPPRRLRYRWLGPAGLALLIVAAAPALIALAGFVRLRRGARATRPPSARQARRHAREMFEELQVLDASGSDARRDAFARLDAVVRQHLMTACGIPAKALTPDEIVAAIGGRDDGPPATAIAGVLQTCERARYAEPADQPSADEWRATLAMAGELLAPER